MKNYRSNLEARYIKLSEDDLSLVLGITKKKLEKAPPYSQLGDDIKTILENNVLIVATTDNVKNIEDKVDTIIANLPDAIKLVMKDAREGSAMEG